MDRILVTGGAGFIGSAFVRHVFEAHDDVHVIVLDLLTYAGDLGNIPERIREDARFEFWPGSVNDVDLVSDLVARSDMVVHFAAETHVARSLYGNRSFFETDVLGTQSVAGAVVRWQDRIGRFVHISSSEVYGDALYEPMDEDHPLNPTTPYAAAKAGADRLVSSYVTTYDLPAVILRPFNNYGPRQHLEKVIPRFITAALLDEPMTIHGDGSAARDWIHVDDTVRGVDLVLRSPLEAVKGEVINLGTERATSVVQLAHMVREALGETAPPARFVEDRLGQVVRHIADGRKASKLVDFTPRVNLETGLEETMRWYADHRDSWIKTVDLRRVPVKLRDGNVVWY